MAAPHTLNYRVVGVSHVFYGVECGRSLKTCEYLVVQNHLATCVADGTRLAACCLGVHLVRHRYDAEHIHVVYAGEFHLGAQVVAARAQHGAPYDADLLSVVRVCVVSLQSLACIVLHAADGVRFGSEVYQLHLAECHLACSHAHARAEAHVERLCASHQVHSLRAEEVDSLLGVEEACLKHLVAQCVNVIILPCSCVANLLLLYRVEPCVGVRLAVLELWQVVVGYGDGLCLWVDLYGGELAVLLGRGHVAWQQRSAHSNLIAVVVCLAVDGDACAANGVRVRHHLLQHPCAAVVLLAVVLPQTHGDGLVVYGVEVDAAVPVHVFVCLAGRGDRLELVSRCAVLRCCLSSLPRLCTRLVADELCLA